MQALRTVRFARYRVVCTVPGWSRQTVLHRCSVLRGSLLLFLGQRSRAISISTPWFRLRRCGASHHRPCIRKPAKAGIMMTGCLRTAAGVNSSIVLLQRARFVADHRRVCDSPEPSSEMCRNVFATITPTVAYGKVSGQTVRLGTLPP